MSNKKTGNPSNPNGRPPVYGPGIKTVKVSVRVPEGSQGDLLPDIRRFAQRLGKRWIKIK